MKHWNTAKITALLATIEGISKVENRQTRTDNNKHEVKFLTEEFVERCERFAKQR
jgi:hypothetical protein